MIALSDAQLLFVTGSATAAVVFGFAWAAIRHRRALARLPIRIHVAGTRGKTSVTRLIWGGLRGGGIQTLAKTTGTVPILLKPDGSEAPWARRGPPSIAEQWQFIRTAAALEVRAVVLECMAVQAEFLWASERFATRATITVITNLRPDHAEALPTDPALIARAMSLAVPDHGMLVLSREAAVEPLLVTARARGTRIEIVDTDGLPPDIVNRRLALAACRLAGVSEDLTEPGMSGAGADPGALRVHAFELENRSLRFINAFACNDVVSLRELWRHHHDASTDALIAVMNPRADRPQRTTAVLQMLRDLQTPMLLFLPRRAFFHHARKAGFAEAEIHLLPGAPAAALRALARAGQGRTEIWGVGNFQGLGEAMSRHLAQIPTPC